MTAQTYGPPRADASFRAARRLVQAGGATLGLAPLADDGRALELATPTVDSPRVLGARLLEGATFRAMHVPGDPVPGFAAFLDGTQRSHVVAYAGTVPIVHATVAAVVRRRVNRRLGTWGPGPLVRQAVYLPRRVAPAAWALYEQAGWSLVDTTEHEESASPHPLALQERAYHAVQAERERAEQTLAEQWCDAEREHLFVDGGISGSERVASAGCAVGVVKSHRTLYAEGDALATILALPAGARTSVFLVTSARRAAVASWYLRLRDPGGHDPMWGLVRVECARTDDVASRADEVSRMVLAEVAPVALPDGRWDRMVYGIRDCEQYLQAVC